MDRPHAAPSTATGSALDDDESVALEGTLGPITETRELRVSAGQHGQRLDKVLVQLAGEFSRSHLQCLIERGHVQIDGATARPASRRLRIGQRLLLELVPTDESLAFRPEAMVLRLLFEDEHLMVIDKPAGLVVHPAPGNWSGTLLNGLLAHHVGAALLPRAGIVHRLDKDTSGLMMVGKTLPAVTALTRAIAAREVHRHYLALAWGVPAQKQISIEAPIGRDPVSRVRMAVVANGRPSRTEVRCVAGHDGISALMCTLHSGRTHQIRVHLAHKGHALVADALYGGRAALGMQRQALHAARLRFLHPIRSVAMQFDALAPTDFAQAWQQVQGGAARWRDS